MLDEQTGKPTQKAVSSFKQAHNICKSIKKTAMQEGGRLTIAGEVDSLYNYRQPFDQKELTDNGQDWRNNFPTGFLASIVDRVTPQMRDPIFRAELLTHAILPPTYERSAEKSRKFCEVTTKVVRGWNGWNDFISLLTQHIGLHGIATPGRLSRDWRPRLFRWDHCYLFDSSGQHASKLQIAIFWEEMLMHEFLELFKDKDAAEAAGYDWKGCIKAANEMTGRNTDDTDKTPSEQEDQIREKGSLGYSAEHQQKTVKLFHLVVREYDGKIALWTTSEKGGHGVRHIEDCEAHMEVGDMADAIALFTLQVGDGNFYGSKGLGRLLANIHIAVERGRCHAADQVYLTGLLILLGDSGDISNTQTHVMHPFVILQGNNLEVAEKQIQFNAENWKMLDDMLVGIAESIAGAFLPPNLNTAGSSNTKIEAAQKAEREIAVRQGVLGRFFAQFADLMAMIQRAIYSVENMREGKRVFDLNQAKKKQGIVPLAKRLFNRLKAILGKDMDKQKGEGAASKIADQEAVEAVVELLEAGLSIDEIVELSLAPCGNDVQSNNAERDEKTIEYIAANMMNPFIDKKKATEMSGRLAIGEDRIKELMNEKEPDPEEFAEQSRQQIMEFGEMMSGEAMQVSARDGHPIHRQVLGPRLGSLIGVLEKTVKGGMPVQEGLVKAASMCIQHYVEHLNQDLDLDPEQGKREMQVMEMWNQLIMEAEKLMQQQMKEAQAAAEEAGAAGGAPGAPNPNEATDAAAIADAAVGVRAQMHQEMKDKGELSLKALQLDLEGRKVDLAERQQAHKEEMEKMKAAAEVTKLTTDTLKAAIDDGTADVQRETPSADPTQKAKP